MLRGRKISKKNRRKSVKRRKGQAPRRIRDGGGDSCSLTKAWEETFAQTVKKSNALAEKCDPGKKHNREVRRGRERLGGRAA